MERVVRVTQRLPPSKTITDPPLQVHPGDSLAVGERSEEWAAFVLVTSREGIRGWVPWRYLRIEGGVAHVLQAYDTTSLDPAPEDRLEVLEDDSAGGWLWCRDARGRCGWFPESHVVPA